MRHLLARERLLQARGTRPRAPGLISPQGRRPMEGFGSGKRRTCQAAAVAGAYVVVLTNANVVSTSTSGLNAGSVRTCRSTAARTPGQTSSCPWCSP